jgi:hypothetical protein
MQKLEYCKTAFLVFVDNMTVPDFALLNNWCLGSASLLAENMNFKFIGLIYDLNQRSR